MKKVYVISEIGINHNGSMDLAKQLIDKSVNAGADAVKFQKRDINLVYSREELDKFRESPWGTTTREQKEGIEFSISQYKELKRHCDGVGIDFIISCWDQKSVEAVQCLDIKYHKVASAMVTDRSFLLKLNATGKPVILSTGMCTQEEVDAAVETLDDVAYVLACTSTYPTAVDELNLRYICTLKDCFPDLKVGFSNHYNGHDACISAASLGAECIEFHITHDRTAYGSDQAASIQHPELLISGIREVELMLGDGVKKVYDSEVPIREKLRKV